MKTTRVLTKVRLVVSQRHFLHRHNKWWYLLKIYTYRGCRFHFYTPVRECQFGGLRREERTHIRTHPRDSPERRERACQLRGNEVHDWITRGCNAIELRLLVRHGVGGRGWRQHLQTASSVQW